MFRIIISFFYLFSKLLHFKQHVTQITSLKHQLRFNIYSIFKSYNSGDINKAKDYKTRLTKMKTHHSSTAIIVNLFQYRLGKAPCPILNSPIRKNFISYIYGTMYWERTDSNIEKKWNNNLQSCVKK